MAAATTPTVPRTTSKRAAIDAVGSACARFVERLHAVRDPNARAVGRWSIAETAAHVAEAIAIEARMVRGEGSPLADRTRLAEFNEERLRAYPERDLTRIATRIRAEARDCIAALEAADWGATIEWFGGLAVPPLTVAGIASSDVEVHGFDVATAEGGAWSVPVSTGVVAFDGLLTLLPHYVDGNAAAGFHACYDVRVRGGTRAHFLFDDATLTIEPPSARKVDCHISADPGTFLLVGYGRVGPIRPALTGKLVAWGRKPWLGLKLPQLLNNP